MSLGNRLLGSDWRESSESLKDLSSSASCSVPTTSAASKPMSKRKSPDANDLGIDDLKQVKLLSYPVSVFGPKKRYFNAAWYQMWDWLEYSVRFDAAFGFPCRDFKVKLEEIFEECIVNQLLQPMAVVMKNMQPN